MASSFQRQHKKVPTLLRFAAREKSLSCFCKIFQALWCAKNMKTRASHVTGPRWSPLWRQQQSPYLLSLLGDLLALETTACVAEPIAPDSCSCGPMRAFPSWVESKLPVYWPPYGAAT